MKKLKKIKSNRLKSFFNRFLILFSLVFMASLFHKVFTYLNLEKLGAFLFIVIFSASIMVYYFKLFNSKSKYRFESIMSVFFIFLLTITMYALIYHEPIDDNYDYFVEFGNQTKLSLPDAFYFSVTTITTLGYGDISPVGFYRFMVMVEVLMGWIYSGSLIYFIVREIEFDELKK